MPHLPQIYLGINYYNTMLRANIGEGLTINFIKIFCRPNQTGAGVWRNKHPLLAC